MNEFDLMNFRQQIIESNIILSFEGQMSQGVLITLVDTLKKKLMEEEKADLPSEENKEYLVRKIYAIFIELAQNIQNHSSEKDTVDQTTEGEGIIIIRENDNCYVIESGNLLENEKVEKLTDYIQCLNQLDDSELRKLYKKKLREARNEGQRGAGIGLIEMIRKSGNPLEYEMKVFNDKDKFFILTVTVDKEAI